MSRDAEPQTSKIGPTNVIYFTHGVTGGGAMNRQSAEGITMSEDAMSSRHSRRRLVRAITAMFVFAVGMLGGAGVAALLMPT